MIGILVLVAGPSGAGKDSILKYAAQKFSTDQHLVFPRRVITRPADIALEDHDTATPEEFLRLTQLGAFAFQWQAHGLCYGVRKSVDVDLAMGRVVAINVSRTILEKTTQNYPNSLVIEITASPEILTARVAARSRKTDGDVNQRVSREAKMPISLPNLVTFKNESPLEVVGELFCDTLERLAQGQVGTVTRSS